MSAFSRIRESLVHFNHFPWSPHRELAGDPRVDPGPSEPGRCSFCRERFPADEGEGLYVVLYPLGQWLPCDFGGVPFRRGP